MPKHQSEEQMTDFGDWFRLATGGKIIVRALKMAMVVGCVLAAINHGDAILHGQMTRERWGRLLLTFCVPYFVSTFSSVAAMREFRRESANLILTKDE